MQIDATPAGAHTILKAMLAVAAAGPAVTDADRASVLAAGRCIFRLALPPDRRNSGMPGRAAKR